MNKIVLAGKRIVLGWLPGGSSHCVLCGNAVWGFIPFQGGVHNQPALIRELQMIGSDVENFSCPRCGGHDRERHLLMYLQSSGMLASMAHKTILHFAPEPRLSAWIRATRPSKYVQCDLEPANAEVCRVDILSIDVEPSSFDYLIANHVLEHVADDRRALREIHRVLKPGGYAILQTPYAAKLRSTWEDSGITDNAARRQAYGQSDHVRLYGRDVFDRFTASGLESQVQQHSELLPGINSSAHGINPHEPFFCFQKTTYLRLGIGKRHQ